MFRADVERAKSSADNTTTLQLTGIIIIIIIVAIFVIIIIIIIVIIIVIIIITIISIIIIIIIIIIMTTCAEQWKLRGRYFSLTVCNAGEIVMFVGGKWTLITLRLMVTKRNVMMLIT